MLSKRLIVSNFHINDNSFDKFILAELIALTSILSVQNNEMEENENV